MPARIDDADIKKYNENYVDSSGAQDRNRTSDTRIFNPLLYQLSYPGTLAGAGPAENARGL